MSSTFATAVTLALVQAAGVIGSGTEASRALAAAEEELRRVPGRVESYFELGALYRRAFRPRDAIDTFARAPSNDAVVIAEREREIALTLAELQAWEPAREHVARSLLALPDHPPTLMVHAVILTRTGNFDEALRVYERLETLAPDSATVWLQRGEMHDSQNRMEDAEASYRAAIVREPDALGSRFRLGKLLLSAGRTQAAERELARAVTLAPEHAESHLELAIALDALDRTAKARHHFERALALRPKLARAHLSYGNFCVRTGDDALGRRHLGTFEEISRRERELDRLISSVEHSPDYETTRRLTDFLLDEGEHLSALRVAQRLWLSQPNEPRFAELVASVYDASGREIDARRVRAYGEEEVR